MGVDERIMELEIKVAYQEDLLDKLNQVIVELRQQLDGLESDIKHLRQQTLAGVEPTGAADEPPPHY